MLTLTENVQNVITGIVDGAQAPQTGGIRISQDLEGAGLNVAVANQPEADDQVVESSGAKVFLDPQAAVADCRRATSNSTRSPPASPCSNRDRCARTTRLRGSRRSSPTSSWSSRSANSWMRACSRCPRAAA